MLVALVLAFLSAGALDVQAQMRGRLGTPARGPRPIAPPPARAYPHNAYRFRPYGWMYGPGASLPVWLRTSAHRLAPLAAMAGPARTVTVGGTAIDVVEPQTIVLPQAVAPDTGPTPAPTAEAKPPFVEFALLAEKRMQDLEAAVEAAIKSPQGIIELEGNKFCKAYTCVYITGFEITPDLSEAAQHKGKITYLTRVMVQLGDTREAVTASQGFPDEGTQPQTSVEQYIYKDGKWQQHTESK